MNKSDTYKIIDRITHNINADGAIKNIASIWYAEIFDFISLEVACMKATNNDNGIQNFALIRSFWVFVLLGSFLNVFIFVKFVFKMYSELSNKLIWFIFSLEAININTFFWKFYNTLSKVHICAYCDCSVLLRLKPNGSRLRLQFTTQPLFEQNSANKLRRKSDTLNQPAALSLQFALFFKADGLVTDLYKLMIFIKCRIDWY